MARVMFTKDSSLPHFYNVDHAVGPGCPNVREDVLLVQYLMKTVFDRRPDERPPGEPLRVDGIAGPITFRHITRVQELAKQKGTSQTVDGRVDKATGAGLGSITHNIFTIINLCVGFMFFRRAEYQNIATAGDCPAELAALISLL